MRLPLAIFLYAIVSVSAFCCSAFGAEDEWNISEIRAWSRQPNAITLSKDENVKRSGIPTNKVRFVGEGDWSLSGGKPIAVKPGDIMEVSAWIQIEGEGDIAISVVPRNAKGDVMEWSYAEKRLTEANDWTKLSTRFLVPRDVATLEPRLTGYKSAEFGVDEFMMKKTGSRDISPKESRKISKSNSFLSVELDPANGLFSVTDKRTGRTWKQSTGMKQLIAVPLESPNDFGFKLLDAKTLSESEIRLTLDKNRPELSVRIEGKGPMTGSFPFPAPFESKSGDRLIIPMNEGISYPVEKTDIRVRDLITYGGHGICMAFWGQIEDATGAGMMGLIETADDAKIQIIPGETKLLQVNAAWEPSMKEFRYPRTIRLVFFDKGGHVAVCKRYRQHAQETGLLVPFTEKVKKTPKIDLLLGAANIWCWEGNKVELVNEMKSLGFDRILWSAGGSAKEIEELNKIENVLTSRYDIYQDIMDPARFPEVKGIHSDWTTEAWPHDINWTSPDGTWRKGWAVTAKDPSKPRISCAVICDAKAVPYARKRISKELETKKFGARFIDTTVAAPWFECYHPDHPMTRGDSRKYKMELLKLIGDLGLVCGSETGHDASVPFCDFYEGMLSLGPYRIHESGRDMIKLVDEVPPQIEEFQVNPALRLPLWELVYHDCVVADWYWGDYNNKLPKVWKKRDLFNVLYGTPPMYMFTKQYWNENKDRFAESYKTSGASARKTAYAEMVDHRILSSDRLVQQSVFSNGVNVFVNFGEKPFPLPDGTAVPAMGWTLKETKISGGK